MFINIDEVFSDAAMLNPYFILIVVLILAIVIAIVKNLIKLALFIAIVFIVYCIYLHTNIDFNFNL